MMNKIKGGHIMFFLYGLYTVKMSSVHVKHYQSYKT